MAERNRNLDALQRLLRQPRSLAPWTGEDRFPWHDPEFSERMLRIHLDESTDQASRRPEVISAHVRWLADRLAGELGRGPFHILDAGCGPGLYCHALARLGHRATGLDIAPAALAWARERAAAEHLDCRFLDADLDALPADLPDQVASGFGLADAVTFWFGDFHGFAAPRAEAMVAALARCLRPGGLFILEYQPLEDFVCEDGGTWNLVDRSALCEEPHLWLQKYAWDQESRTEVHAHWIIPVRSGRLLQYRQCHQGWTDDDLDRMLRRCGLERPQRHPPVTGIDPELEFPVVVTRRTVAERDLDPA